MPTVFRWLTGSPAAGSAVAPNAQRIGNGWVANLPIPAEAINWAWKALSELTTAAQRFDRLEDAVEALQDGETGIVVEGDPDLAPFYGQASGTAWSGQVDGEALLAVSARYLVVFDDTGGASNGSFIAERPEGSFTGGGPTGRTDVSMTSSPTTQRAVATDGVTFAFAYDQYVEAFDVEGTKLWRYDHGAAVHDIAVHGGQVFLCGALGTGSEHVRSISVSAGTATWSYRHSTSGVVYAIDTNGAQVFFGGDVSSYSSGAALRAVDFEDGADAANEGGTAASTTGLAWDDGNGANTVNARGIAATGDRMVVACTIASVGQAVQIRAPGSGAIIAGDSYIDDFDATQVAIDHRFAYVAQSDGASSGDSHGGIAVYDLDSGARAYRVETSPYLTTNNQISAIATDGRVLWANSPGNSAMVRFHLPYRPELVRRVDGDEQGNALPMELQYVGGR